MSAKLTRALKVRNQLRRLRAAVRKSLDKDVVPDDALSIPAWMALTKLTKLDALRESGFVGDPPPWRNVHAWWYWLLVSDHNCEAIAPPLLCS